VPEAGNRDRAFDADGNPVQRANSLSPLKRLVCYSRFAQRCFPTQLDKRIQLGIELFDSIEMRLDKLKDREPAFANELRHLND
jgi:hypothetical protein